MEGHARARARQAELERAAAEARTALTAATAAGLTGAALRLRAEGAADLRGRASVAATATAAAASHVEERRAALVDAARDRRALERLQAMQHGAWQADLTRHEQHTTDEIATTRHGRSS
jgi:flagellar export protein FliJ